MIVSKHQELLSLLAQEEEKKTKGKTAKNEEIINILLKYKNKDNY